MRVDLERVAALCAELSEREPVQPGSAESSLIAAIGGNSWYADDGSGGVMCGQFLLSWFRPANDEPCLGRSRPNCYRIEVREDQVPSDSDLARGWRAERMWRVEQTGWQDQQRICTPASRWHSFADFLEIDGAVRLWPWSDHIYPYEVTPISLPEYLQTFQRGGSE